MTRHIVYANSNKLNLLTIDKKKQKKKTIQFPVI